MWKSLTLQEISLIDSWINTVSISHSNSIGTSQSYKLSLRRFCDFIEKTPDEIGKDYDNSNDRDFKRTYAKYVKSWIAFQMRNGMSPNSINTRVGAVKSFFKYNDFPLGFVPAIKLRVLYHNRDISHKEIKLILNSSRPRERAFYSIMAQSGLRPNTICNLKYENIKDDFESGTIPCRIDIPQEIAKGKYHSYFTFIGKEAVNFLKSYLVVRPQIKDDDFIFLKDGTKQQTSPKSISVLFGRTVKKLNEKKKMNLKQKKETKPHDIRLYNLRKFFRKYANQAGFEFVQFWMGHTVNAGQDDHYRPTDVEFHRKLYEEKAMPHLRLETSTPTETDKAIISLEQENRELKEKLGNLESLMEKMYEKVFPHELQEDRIDQWIVDHPEYIPQCEYTNDEINEMRRKQKEYDAKHPEERKRREEAESARIEEYAQYLEEHSKNLEEQIKLAKEENIRSNERRKILTEIQNLVEKTKRHKNKKK